jgi:glutathione peroxidase
VGVRTAFCQQEISALTTIYEFSAKTLDGKDVSMHDYEGRVLMIVNTASKCGFTPQYAGLEALYEKLAGQGFAVLGFPCNQFGSQEPGTESEIGAFCEKNYGVSFPMFAKVDVNGGSAHPLWQYLKTQKKGFLGSGRIKWNFTKFLVNRAGKVVARCAPMKKPGDLEAPVRRLVNAA